MGRNRLPKIYEEHGGEVLSTSIDRYAYLTVSRLDPLFQHRIRVAYAKTELVREISEIQHPSVRACPQHLGMKGGVEISVSASVQGLVQELEERDQEIEGLHQEIRALEARVDSMSPLTSR